MASAGYEEIASTSTKACIFSLKKRKIPKNEDDSVPLPDPFPLPKHYRADVEAALNSGKMTTETRSSFLSSVASAMLTYKRYPTKEDYICVARTVTKQYPFLASPTGIPYVSISIIEGLVSIVILASLLC